MESNKSLDESKIIAALLHDIHMSHGAVFNYRSLKNTLNKVNSRLRCEGMGFLTKSLPRLGKAFDRALAAVSPLNCTEVGFENLPGTKLPRFLGELFSRVLQPNGELLSNPCVKCVRDIRQTLYLFYKYELPYSHEQELEVLGKFERTEQELRTMQEDWKNLSSHLDSCYHRRRRSGPEWAASAERPEIAREARILLAELFSCFDPLDIYPRHGPGVVSTKEKMQEKYQWRSISRTITDVYPEDAYFYASLGHVCDRFQDNLIPDDPKNARVLLVPKDSRGPRLISCEPLDNQWIQQGLGRAIVRHVESHPLTQWNVRFTNQHVNQRGALLGSYTGKYSTLDLNEASDRVSVGLVRLLFPPHLIRCLEACRSRGTELPDGRILDLDKFAPMGSGLCFPVLSLVVWAILTAGAPDDDTREGIAVYGDDVVVPTQYAPYAIKHLESFGLKINQDKSCTKGLFRESCGTDAFNGVDVTPVKLKTVWSSSPSPKVYVAWIDYANALIRQRSDRFVLNRPYYAVYELIVESLRSVYGPIPGKDMGLTCPSLAEVPLSERPRRRRVNKSLQKLEYRVWDVKAPSVRRRIDGWSMLLRYFAEAANDRNRSTSTQLGLTDELEGPMEDLEAFRVCQYTGRRTSMLVRRWR
jgi:hypothetical protein